MKNSILKISFCFLTILLSNNYSFANSPIDKKLYVKIICNSVNSGIVDFITQKKIKGENEIQNTECSFIFAKKEIENTTKTCYNLILKQNSIQYIIYDGQNSYLIDHKNKRVIIENNVSNFYEIAKRYPIISFYGGWYALELLTSRKISAINLESSKILRYKTTKVFEKGYCESEFRKTDLLLLKHLFITKKPEKKKEGEVLYNESFISEIKEINNLDYNPYFEYQHYCLGYTIINK